MVIIKGETISCLSGSIYYRKERDYIKRNTVRALQDIISDGYTLDSIMNCGEIKIINSETEEHFKRKIRDISLWKGNVIISW